MKNSNLPVARNLVPLKLRAKLTMAKLSAQIMIHQIRLIIPSN